MIDEKHYTINELAAMLNMSLERTRQLVKDEPGVLRFVSASVGKRSRTMYRIPESVVQRILRRSANPAAPTLPPRQVSTLRVPASDPLARQA